MNCVIRHSGTLLDRKKLINELDPSNIYIILAKNIDWLSLNTKILSFYDQSFKSRRLPLRLLCCLTILKYLDNLSDEKVCERWKTDHYYQAFCGYDFINDALPCDPSTLSIFRKRIGVEGINAIFNASVKIFGDKYMEKLKKELIIDSTVQEKYTSFPTDIKLAVDVIRNIWLMCDNNEIKLRSKHKKEVKKLNKLAAFNKSNKRNEIKANVLTQLRSIGLDLLREMTNKLPDRYTTTNQYFELHYNYYKVLTQQKDDKNKIYSIFEPQIYCISKGKVHKKYEFGTKVGLFVHRSGLICTIKSFDENLHDSKTTENLLDHMYSNIGFYPDNLIGDNGYRGRKYFGKTTLITPIKDVDKLDKNSKKIYVKRMNDRSTIEQTISHMKNDFRLGRNELRGSLGDKINPLLSAAAHNFALYVRITKNKLKNSIKNKIGSFANKVRTLKGVTIFRYI